MANEQRQLSSAGAKFIADFEGCVLHPYNDPWNATIGIGHLIHEGRATSADFRRYRRFTLSDAYALLRIDVRSAEAGIRQRIRVDLNQNQWDALVSLVFNCGPGVLDGQVGNDINEHAWQAATEAWQAWCHGNGGVVLEGLVRRRQAEAKLFLEKPAPPPPYVPADEQRWEHEYDRLPHKGTRAKVRRRALRRAMTQRRKVIWHLAQQSGWEKLNRADRYRALLARTEG